MQRSRNPLEDCLKIFAYFGGIGGLYALYHLFQAAGSIITSQDIKILLMISTFILAMVGILIFSYLGIFVSERALLILSRYRNFKKEKVLTSGSNMDPERLIHLELALASVLKGMERRLRLLEEKVMEERKSYEYSLYPQEEGVFVNPEEDPWAPGEIRQDSQD